MGGIARRREDLRAGERRHPGRPVSSSRGPERQASLAPKWETEREQDCRESWNRAGHEEQEGSQHCGPVSPELTAWVSWPKAKIRPQGHPLAARPHWASAPHLTA